MILKVNEIFFTFQGEGKNIGMPCTFLRLAMCNLHCVWCDTWYSWNFGKGDGIEKRHGSPTVKIEDELHELSTEKVLEKLIGHNTKNLVISGGEPMLQQKALSEMFRRACYDGYKFDSVEIETNGTIPLTACFDEWVTQINCSPKLENSGNLKVARYKPDVLKQLQATDKAWFKFVIDSEDDLKEVDNIVNECGMKKVEDWREQMKKAGLDKKMITAYHPKVIALGEYDKMLVDSTSGYVALEGYRIGGGRLPYNKLIKMAYNKGVRVHGFAMTKAEVIQKYPFYSIDSSSWKACVRFGHGMVTEGLNTRYIKFKQKKSVLKTTRLRDISALIGENKKEQYYSRLSLSVDAYKTMERNAVALWKARGIDWEAQIKRFKK